MMDVTGVEICWACLSARKETLETFKLRDYQRDQPQGQNPDGAIRSSDGLQQMIVIQCTTANFTQIMTWKFTGEDLAEECFPSGCCLQHYANTDTSKMQVTSEGAKGAQSWRKNLLLREYQMEQKTWLNCMIVIDKPEFNCSEYKILKMPVFFCLNMLEICKQTIFEAKLEMPWLMMILKGSTCIPTILLRDQRLI